MITEHSEQVELVEKYGKTARGKRELLMHYDGSRLTPKQAIYAKCYDCLGFYDGLTADKDCKDHTCPLYPYMPYNPNRVRTERNPKNLVTARSIKRRSMS